MMSDVWLVAGGLDDGFGCDHRDLAIHVTRGEVVAPQFGIAKLLDIFL